MVSNNPSHLTIQAWAFCDIQNKVSRVVMNPVAKPCKPTIRHFVRVLELTPAIFRLSCPHKFSYSFPQLYG